MKIPWNGKMVGMLLSLLLCLQMIPAFAEEAPETERDGQAVTCIVDLPDDPVLMAASGDRVIILTWEETWLRATVYALSDGEVLAEAKLDGNTSDVRLLPDGSAVFLKMGENRFICYDRDLSQCLWTWEIPDDGWALLRDDGYGYAIGLDSTVYRIRLTDGEVASLCPEIDRNGTFRAFAENRTLVEYSDWESGPISFWMDWDAKEVQPGASSVDTGNTVILDDWATFRTSSSLYLRRIGEDAIYVRDIESDSLVHSIRDDLILCGSADYMQVWELEEGLTWTLREQSPMLTCLTEDAVVYTDADGETVYCWEFRREEPVREETVWTEQWLTEQNEADAASITGRTGMEVYYGDAGILFNETEDSGYAETVVDDPLLIHLAFEQLMQLIGEYPEEIFEEMLVPPYETLEIYLCGPIHGTGEYCLSSAAGFAHAAGKSRRVVLDISQVLEPDTFRLTFAHELMHVMEDRIYACGTERNVKYLVYWFSFLPEGCDYFNNYERWEAGAEMDYTASPGLPAEETYFIDSYSCTYPTEDLARILENLYAGAQGRYAYVFEKGPLREKAEYLCSVIRECFPSCQSAGTLPWETLLEEVPPFSVYEEAVKVYEPEAKG